VRSDNKDKAVNYLVLANQKAGKLNAMEEAKAYFEEAMKLLDTLPESKVNQERRISLLVNQWLVFTLLFQTPEYYDLLTRYEHTAIDLGNPGLLGAFYAGMGQCQWWLGNYDQAIQTSTKAAELCETEGDSQYAGLAYNYLQWTYLCKGDFDQVFTFKEKTLRTLEQRFNLRLYVWALVSASWAYASLHRFEEAAEEGKEGLRVAEEFSDSSLISFAAWVISVVYILKGELGQAIEYGELAVQRAPTPADKMWTQGILATAWCRAGKPHRGVEVLAQTVSVQKAGSFRFGAVGFAVMLGEGYFLAGEYDKATRALQEGLLLAERSGMEHWMGLAHLLLGQMALKTDSVQAAHHFEQGIALFRKTKAHPSLIEFVRSMILLTEGNLTKGVKVAEGLCDVFLENGSMWNYVNLEYMLGNIYLQIVAGTGPKTFTFLAKNIAFLIKSFSRASEKAEYHLNKAITSAKEIGARSVLGQAYHDLGLLYKTEGRSDQALECISKAIQIFEECEAQVYLAQAKETLSSMG
jgi:tetratricopeptide (TPR) repeat protein